MSADQEIPWADKPLVFSHKYRLWVQPYNESYHTEVGFGNGAALLIGSPYEYDVPKFSPWYEPRGLYAPGPGVASVCATSRLAAPRLGSRASVPKRIRGDVHSQN